jgi:hypothetical protein
MEPSAIDAGAVELAAPKRRRVTRAAEAIVEATPARAEGEPVAAEPERVASGAAKPKTRRKAAEVSS